MITHRFARRTWLPALVAVSLLALPAHAEDEEAAEDTGPWSGQVSLGGSVSSGEIDAFNGAIEASAERNSDPHLLRLRTLLAYGTTEDNSTGEKNTQNDKQEVAEYYRYSFTEQFYVYGDALQGRDSVQSIRFRFLGNVGPGWRAWQDGENEFLDLEAGVGYRFENRDGSNEDIDDGTARFALAYSNMIGPARFRQTGEFLLPFQNTSQWLAIARTTLSFPLVAGWSFDNSLLFEYNNAPAARETANTGFVKKAKLDYIVGLSYSF